MIGEPNDRSSYRGRSGHSLSVRLGPYGGSHYLGGGWRHIFAENQGEGRQAGKLWTFDIRRGTSDIRIDRRELRCGAGPLFYQ